MFCTRKCLWLPLSSSWSQLLVVDFWPLLATTRYRRLALASDFRFRFRLFCDWWSVGQPVLLGAHDQIFIIVEHLRSSCWGAPSLTRRRVYNLLVQFAVTLRSKSRRTHDHVLLSHTRLPNLEGQVPVFISPRNRMAQLYLGHWVPLFVVSYDSQGIGSVPGI
jgi:hypothetical protein